MRRRSSLAIVFASVLALLGTSAATAAPTAGDQARVVVVLRDDVNARSVARDAAREHRAEVSFVYEDALRGFAASVPRGRLNGLRNDPRVDYVEPDRIHTIQAQATPTGIRRIFADTNTGIDIDRRDDFRVDVDVAVLDTGIDYEHPDLNVVGGQNCLGRWWYASCTAGGDDDHYHGTHVAGTIGALDNGQGVVGVAPGARLWAVKVLDKGGSGYTSEIVAGINWVAGNADTIEVANMSLSGSGYNQAEYDAIQGAVDAGVAFAVAAGNSDANANNYSPAAFGNVLTVSALADFDGAPGGLGSPTCRADEDDTLANFSNWGSAVDITAPGVCIESTYPLEQGGYGTISGTSMASPHAAGALALLASSTNATNATAVEALYDQVINTGNGDWTDDSDDGIREPLLDVTEYSATLVAGDDGGTTNSPPTVSLTNPAEGETVGGTVTATADASDDDAVTQVEFFVDGDSLHIDSDGDDGWSASWDTSAVPGGTHTISATATDATSQTATHGVSVTVANGPTAGITLSVTGYKVKGLQKADLTWSGATSGSNVDITRDGEHLQTVESDDDGNGVYTDHINRRGGGSYTYQVCETGTDKCSSDVRISF